MLSYSTLHCLVLRYHMLHCITLHNVTVSCISSHYIPSSHMTFLLLCFTHHFTTLSCFALCQLILCYVPYIIICCIALQFVQSHSLALPCITLCYASLCWAESSKLLLVNHFLSPEMQHPQLTLVLTAHPLLLLSGGVQQNCHSSCYGLNKENTA